MQGARSPLHNGVFLFAKLFLLRLFAQKKKRFELIAFVCRGVVRRIYKKHLTTPYLYDKIVWRKMTRCGSVWGRLRPLPVADEGSNKEWQ